MSERGLRVAKALIGWVVLSIIFLGIDLSQGGMMGRGGTINWAWWPILGVALWPIFAILDALYRKE